MKITEVRISLCQEEKLKAFANVTFDEEFVVRGLKVIEGRSGLFVSMPSRRRSDGTYQDIAHPITSKMRSELEAAVVSAYEVELQAAQERKGQQEQQGSQDQQGQQEQQEPQEQQGSRDQQGQQEQQEPQEQQGSRDQQGQQEQQEPQEQQEQREQQDQQAQTGQTETPAGSDQEA